MSKSLCSHNPSKGDLPKHPQVHLNEHYNHGAFSQARIEGGSILILHAEIAPKEDKLKFKNDGAPAF